MINKTIKQVADEFGITKQAIRKHLDKLPPTLKLIKEGNTYYLSSDIQDFLKKKISTVGSKVDTKVDTQVDILKDNIIADKQVQIDKLLEQNEHLSRLLDQQQQLQLKTQELLEEKTLLLETTQNKKWWKFWS